MRGVDRMASPEVVTTTEMHSVFATGYDGKTYRVSDPLDWQAAQREWHTLDDLHRAGRMPHVKFYEVRTVFVGPDRPLVGPTVTSHDRYDGAPLSMLHRTPTVEGSRGFKHVEDAARAAWKRAHPTFASWYDRRLGRGTRTGTQGLGGWFYYSNGETAAQGLRSLAETCKRRRMVVQGGDGRWHVLAPEVE